jgi:aminoglycoside phosphotransferase (APT) family kinase protein
MTEYVDRLVDMPALERYLAESLSPVNQFSITCHPGGHSNETLFVEWGSRDLVLRRPPPGETADAAHDVLREYRIYKQLQKTPIPVPRTVLSCDDLSIIGSNFYLMERVEGAVIDDEPDRFANPDARKQISKCFIDTLAKIHSLDYDGAGLGDLGTADGFTERQVERWGKQFEWARTKTQHRREIPKLRTVQQWLEENVPNSVEHTLIHGDFMLDNLMFAPGTPPQVNAVLDWEMGTLGDPFTDLGWAFTNWRDPKDPDLQTPNLLSEFTKSEGYLTRKGFVDRYESQTGFEFENNRFYRTLGVFKLAAVGEMFYARYLEGNSKDPLYAHMEDEVPCLAERAIRIIDHDEPL